MRRRRDWRTRFWFAIAVFAWRRIPVGRYQEPVGLPGRRDPAHLCQWYDPRRGSKDAAIGRCSTDGHYLCEHCLHISADALADRKGEPCLNP